MKKINPKLTQSLAIMALALGTTAAQAAIIASDSFNQAVGTANGITAGSGFSTTWTADGAYSITSGSLSYSDPLYTIASSGNSLTANGSWSGMRADFAPVTGRVWFSYLFKVNAFNGGDFHQSQLQQGDTEAFKMGMRKEVSIDGVPFSEHNIAGATGALENENYFVAGNTYLLVGTYSTDGVAPSAMWVNPVLGGSDPTTGYETSMFSGPNWTQTNLSRFSFYAINANWSVDNLVIGTTFSDVVTTIPEPSTYAALVGALGLGFAALRRRRS